MDAPAPPLRIRPDGRLPGLDLLRGIAALCVLHFHVMTVFFDGRLPSGKGYLAVDFFFMLSGYVMARTYEDRFAEGHSAGKFMAGRYRRLWPVMAIGALIGAPMVAIEFGDPAVWMPVALANAFLVPVFAMNVLYPVNTAAWSILAELAVNLLHAVLLWRLPSRWLAWLPALLLPALVWLAMQSGTLDLGAGVDSIHVGLLRAAFAYSIGVLLWRWWRDRPTLRVPPLVAFLAMPLALLAGQVLNVESWAAEIGFVLLCPVLIAGGLAWKGDGRIAAWLGAISFPLYAVNSPVLHWFEGLGLGPLPGIACALLLAACIARRMSPQARPNRSVAIA